MGNSFVDPDAHALVLELSRGRTDGHVTLVLSIPGREGTVTRKWGLPGAQGITPSQLEDLLCSVQGSIVDWILAGGVQQTLL